MIKTIYVFLIIVLVSGTMLSAQGNSHEISLGFGSAAGAGKNLPFWIFSNRYSLLDNHPFNIYSRIKYKKSFSDNRNIDFSAAAGVINRFSNRYELYPEEIYGILKFYFIHLQAGRIRENFGNHDQFLSSGGLLWSGNALPVPCISIITPEFIDLPFSRGFLQTKAGIYHGWFGKNDFVKNALLHHKYLYFKAGGDLPVNISAGLHHYAQWGGVSSNPEYGELPSDLKAFRRIFFASQGGDDSPVFDQENAAGNHLGSYNLSADIKLAPFNIRLYWQSIFEDNSGRKNQNLWDGLYGISLVFNNNEIVQRALIEVLSTTHQSGAPQESDPADYRQYIWNDNYFNHWLYRTGWSYSDMALGNPLITSPVLFADENDYEYFNNNRVRAIHTGIAGKIHPLEYSMIFTFTQNLGTYGFPYNPARYQGSLLMNVLFPEVMARTDLSISLGYDRGKLLGENIGFLIRMVKGFII